DDLELDRLLLGRARGEPRDEERGGGDGDGGCDAHGVLLWAVPAGRPGDRIRPVTCADEKEGADVTPAQEKKIPRGASGARGGLEPGARGLPGEGRGDVRRRGEQHGGAGCGGELGGRDLGARSPRADARGADVAELDAREVVGE